MNLTLDQIEAVKHGETVRLHSQEVGEEIVLLTSSAFQRIRDEIDEAADQKLRQAWDRAIDRGRALLLQDSE